MVRAVYNDVTILTLFDCHVHSSLLQLGVAVGTAVIVS
jgi:hypothetical protein